MALTPEDVVNKRFQPTRLREGYDQDEVDDFLDEIVVELRRLNSENEELRRKAGGDSSGSPAAATVPAPVAASSSTESLPADAVADDAAADDEALTDDSVVAEAATPAEVSDTTSGPAATSASAESAAGVLAMAQRLHDEYVNAGVEQRDKIISEAQIEATGLVSDAEEKSIKTLGDLEEQKTVLERQVEQLRSFERDYRARLKSYIEGQLSDLDSHGPLATDTTAS